MDGEDVSKGIKGGDANQIGRRCWKCGCQIFYTDLPRGVGYKCLNCSEEHYKKYFGKRSTKTMGWKQKNPVKIEFSEEGMVVEGKIVAVQHLESLKVNSYTLESADGSGLVTFLGNTVLDKTINDELDSVVRIEYLGEEKTSGGFKVKQFNVNIWVDDDEPDVKEVAEAEEAKAEPKTNKK